MRPEIIYKKHESIHSLPIISISMYVYRVAKMWEELPVKVDKLSETRLEERLV